MTRTLTPWTTRFPRFFEMENDFPKWMTEVFGEPGVFGREGKFMPEVNMTETDQAVEITAELPGLKPEEVKVELHEGALWIMGEKKEEKEEKGKTFHRMERRTGAFRRVLPLPTEVDEGKVEAKFEQGLLKIALPEAARVAPKKIEIK
jgi:HSP20 family protein